MPDPALQEQQELVTVFGLDGSVTTFPPRPWPLDEALSLEARPPLLSLPLTEEQGLTIGSVFTIRASNGVDSCRRLSLLGFCHSVDHLHEKVELVVRQRGGAVVSSERQLTSALAERLHMCIAIPLLFGVPPEHERLRAGVLAGGGIIDRVVQQWLVGCVP